MQVSECCIGRLGDSGSVPYCKECMELGCPTVDLSRSLIPEASDALLDRMVARWLGAIKECSHCEEGIIPRPGEQPSFEICEVCDDGIQYPNYCADGTRTFVEIAAKLTLGET